MSYELVIESSFLKIRAGLCSTCPKMPRFKQTRKGFWKRFWGEMNNLKQAWKLKALRPYGWLVIAQNLTVNILLLNAGA
jgi:hypothetical protein